MPVRKCPCGSGLNYSECCATLIELGVPAETAEQLMRSRFTAYVLNKPDYLFQTWHSDTRPDLSELANSPVKWDFLKVISANEATNRAEVEFLARGHADGHDVILHERSRFINEDEQWYYLDGEIFAQPSKNGLCPCGSGKKFKRCCGK